MRCRAAFARSLAAIALFLLALAMVHRASAQSAPRIPARIAAPASLRPHTNSSQPAVATPVLSLAEGSYSGPQTVTVTDATPGVAIYYTTDGSYPTTSSPQYNGSIAISKSCTLVVMATLSGYPDNYAFAAYYITSVPDSFVYDVAGSGRSGYAGDGGPATQALLSPDTTGLQAAGTAVDSSGNLYIADIGNNVVRKVDATSGIITTIAGNGAAGYSGDGGPATSAQLNSPDSLAFDSAGNLYISDKYNQVVRRITMSTGVISTYAGQSANTVLGDGGPATSANIGWPFGIAIDGSDNLYILCRIYACGNGRVREVDAKTQTITTVAGGGSNSETGGGPAIQATLASPVAIALDSAANVYIADGVVFKVTRSTGNINILAGTPGSQGFSGDGGPATSAKLSSPDSLAVDSNGNVYIDDGSNWVLRKVDATTGNISTAAGNHECFAFVEDGSEALASDICYAEGLSFDTAGNLYFADTNTGYISELTVLGTPPSTPTPDPTFSLAPGAYSSPQSLSLGDTAIGAEIYLYIVTNPPSSYDATHADESLSYLLFNSYYTQIPLTGPVTLFARAAAPGHIPSKVVSAAYTYTVPPHPFVSAVAGNGTYGFSGQGGPATSAELEDPGGMAMDSTGNLFIADDSNNVVWKVDTSGIISIVAGTGQLGDAGDNGPATAATLEYPSDVVVDHSGNIFIADTGNNIVREVLASNGNIVPYAGNGQSSYNGSPAAYGDGGPAASAFVPSPVGLALDANSNLYISDGLGRVREVNASTGIIETFAGGANTLTGLGDGGPAASAYLYAPEGLAFDATGDLYIADNGDNRVREVNAKTGIISTVAGDGSRGFAGAAGLATEVAVSPIGIAFDGNGNLFISNDSYNLLKVDAQTNMVSTVAGIGYAGYAYDPESASTTIACPNLGILSDPQSNIYFSDGCNFTVRKITYSTPAPAPTFNPAPGDFSSPQSITISDTASTYSIFYTTDGSTPTTSSGIYDGPISIGTSETIKAMVTATGYSAPSAVVSATYIIRTAPTITWATPAPIFYGTKLSSTQLDATASVPGTFAYSPAAGTVLPYGSQKLSVTFTPSDTADYTSVTDSVNIAVNKTTPTATLTSSATAADVSEAITLTATVSSPAGTPTGSVTFYNGTTQLGVAALSKGIATYTTSALTTAGSYRISAQYTGDTNFADAFSNTVAINVSSFGVSTPSGGSTSATISPGGTATYKLTVTPPGDNPVSLSVTGEPVGAATTFNPDSVPAGGPTSTVTLSITVPSQSSATVPERPGRPSRMPLVFGVLLLPLMGLRRLRKGHRALLALLLGIAGAAGLATLNGCGGGGSNGGGGGGGQQSQTFNLTVTATAGSATQTTALTLTVE